MTSGVPGRSGRRWQARVLDQIGRRMSQYPANGLDPEMQRWADVLTVDKLAVIRTGDQYRRMVLAARAVHAAMIGLPGILCVGLQFGLTGLLVLVVLYVA